MTCQCSPHAHRELNVAVTLASDVMVSVHVPEVPEHAPDQPENTELQPGAAVRVTTVPTGKLGANGLFVTLPHPDPLLATARVQAGAIWVADSDGEMLPFVAALAVTAYVSAKVALMLWLFVTLLKAYDVTAPTDAPSTVTAATL